MLDFFCVDQQKPEIHQKLSRIIKKSQRKWPPETSKVPVDQVENLQVMRQVVKPVVEYVEKTVPKVRGQSSVNSLAISNDSTENDG